MPSDPVRCADLVDLLSGGSDDLVQSRPLQTHLEACLRCQAELATHRRLRREMRSLAATPPPSPLGFPHEILLALDRDEIRQPRRVPTRAAATIGGLAAAAGVIALATRQRRGSRLAG